MIKMIRQATVAGIRVDGAILAIASIPATAHTREAKVFAAKALGYVKDFGTIGRDPGATASWCAR